jgi:CRISPR/Cas system CSM-associated protein Csm4 (group 5 of RAMP superfamily)
LNSKNHYIEKKEEYASHARRFEQEYEQLKELVDSEVEKALQICDRVRVTKTKEVLGRKKAQSNDYFIGLKNLFSNDNSIGEALLREQRRM